MASLVLCNSFTDTAIFRYNDEASAMWLLPTLALKRMVMSGLQMGNTDCKISEATEFILERLESLGHSDLASRLTLSCLKGFVEPQNVNDLPVTIIDVFDECSLTQVPCFVHHLWFLTVEYSRMFETRPTSPTRMQSWPILKPVATSPTYLELKRSTCSF